jgi:hypothetical protein
MLVYMIEYHLCVDDCPEFNKLLNFLQAQDETLYTNHGYEYALQRGKHIHCAIFFKDKPKCIDSKSLRTLKNSLNFHKQTSDKHPVANGWYFRPASTDNNLAYVLKPQTKQDDKPNVEWYHPYITVDQRDEIEKLISNAKDIIQKHNKRRNGDTSNIIQYIDLIEEPKFKETKINPDHWRLYLEKHLKVFIVNYYIYNDMLFPVPSKFSQYHMYLAFHYKLVNQYDLAKYYSEQYSCIQTPHEGYKDWEDE